MRLGSWNVRGFGADNKKGMIKDCIWSEKLDLIGLVETKHAEVTQWDLIKCWGQIKSDFSHVAARNNSGGIIVTWKQESFDLKNSFATARWLCLVGIFHKIQLQCAICFVYAPNDPHERLNTWDQLRRMKSHVDVPCIIMGDFNEILEPKERRNVVGYTQGMRDLQNLLSDLQLVDMDIGQNYTWFRKNAASRIDRVWVDKEILLKVPNGKVRCKGRLFSDHHPLVFTTEQVQWGPKPFRTIDSWLEEPSFMKTFSLSLIHI